MDYIIFIHINSMIKVMNLFDVSTILYFFSLKNLEGKNSTKQYYFMK